VPYDTNELEAIKGILGSHPKTVVHKFHIPAASFHLAFRLDQKPFDDVRVRRAISMAIDREEMNRLVYAGRGRPYSIGIPWPAVFDKWPGQEVYGPYYLKRGFYVAHDLPGPPLTPPPCSSDFKRDPSGMTRSLLARRGAVQAVHPIFLSAFLRVVREPKRPLRKRENRCNLWGETCIGSREDRLEVGEKIAVSWPARLA
jgi:hypothetical protein